MRVRVLQHAPFEDLGSIRPWLERRRSHVATTRRYEQDTATDADEPSVESFDWLIVMGGPMSVNDAHPWLAAEKQLIARAIHQGKVVLGICLGAQLIASSLGARVYRNRQKEIGWFPVWKPRAEGVPEIARLIPDGLQVFHWHGDACELPMGAVRIAWSDACDNQAFTIGDRVLGLQFHLEMTPGAAARLIESCQSELVAGPGIQSEADMLVDTGRFDAINQVLDAMLDFLADRDSSPA